MTGQARDDEVRQWLAADQPPPAGEEFWAEVDLTLGNEDPTGQSPQARRPLVIAAVVVLIAAGLGAAFAFGFGEDDPIVVAADEQDDVGLVVEGDPDGGAQQVEVAAPPAVSSDDPAPTPIALATSGEGARICPGTFDLSTDGQECFLVGPPTTIAQDPTAADEVIDAAIEDGQATCPPGWSGPTAGDTCLRTVLTASPDLVTCPSGVPARVQPPDSGATPGSEAADYSSASVGERIVADSCLLDRVPAFALQVPATGTGDRAVCPRTHPHRLVDVDETMCLLPGPAPAGLFATAKPDAGKVIPDATTWDETTAEASRSVPVFDAPDGESRMLEYEYLDGTRVPFALVNPTWFGNPLVLRVLELDASGEWLRVHAPSRPAQRSVWVRARSFALGHTALRVEVDIGPNLLRVIDADDVVILETKAASGRADRPTPLEQVYVTEAIDGPNAAYGPRVLWIASYSHAINTFSGGVPVQRLHGTNTPELIGQRVTSGAIRVMNEQIALLDELAVPGTPVLLYDSRSPETDRDSIVGLQPDAPAPTVAFDPTIPPLAPG